MEDIWEQEPTWHLRRGRQRIGRVQFLLIGAGTPWCWAAWPPSGDGERCGYTATREEAMAAVERVLGQASA